MSEQNYANVQQQAELMKYISDNMKIPVLGAGGGFAPIGFYGFSCDYVLTPPQGWLFADGSIYNIADYPEYAALLASQHGRTNVYGGDGVTTFATKDLRGEFLRGWGQNSHANQGNGGAVGEHQDGTKIPALGASGSGTMYIGIDDVHNQDAINNNTSYASIKGSTGSTSGVEAFTSRPTNTSVAFFVKATVSGDANAHQYSTEEQVVGKWIDESNIYEKTVIGLSKQTTWASQYSAAFSITDSELGISSGNIERILSGNCYAEYQGENLTYTISNMTTNPTTHTHILAIHDSVVVTGVTIQYTKTQ